MSDQQQQHWYEEQFYKEYMRMKEAHGRMEREVMEVTNQMRESKNREREVLQGERELREEVRVKALKIEELSNQL
jgi:hypothetical protein